MFAEICVDIPAAQVNQLYTYRVPKKFEKFIQVGMRVNVPFGRRQLLGIICNLKNNIEYNGKIREISNLLDYESFLNQELIDLSEYLARDLQTYRINILHAMLPNMLRVKYESRFYILNRVCLSEYFISKNINYDVTTEYILKEELESLLSPQQIREFLENNILNLKYVIVDQQTTKIETQLTTSLPFDKYQEILESLPSRNYKQRRLITYIIENYPIQSMPINDFISSAEVNRVDILSAIKKSWIEENKISVYRNPLDSLDVIRTTPKNLNEEQRNAYEIISRDIENNYSNTYLLEGVTGSGKTEIYLQLIENAIQNQKSAILLVPEISLTPQMIQQVTGRFDSGVAVLHSGLTVAEKYDEWRRISRGEAKIVVGARSSIFAPMENIGVIIIDEEHETTYKQNDNPRYHARDVAIWRSNFHNCPLVLGSATPSLESRARAEKNKYQLIHLNNRVNKRPLPPVEIIDMTKVSMEEQTNEISSSLYIKIKERLALKEQVILLLNRRGYASYMLCRDCGYVLQCPNCDISLTYHKSENRMKCHYCDYYESVPNVCPQCKSKYIRTHGSGTQKIAETLNNLFPEAKVIRMDNDTTKKKGSHQDLLQQFEEGKGDILLGTQMIAKGLDFENVTLVGVINADTSLNLPDFRASERTFQLLTQVSGRTGRGKLEGEVVIQTFNPDHYALIFAKTHNYEEFFYKEMQYRHYGNYPPYFYTTLVIVSSKHHAKAQEGIHKIKRKLLQDGQKYKLNWLILGPNESPIARLNNTYYYQILIKYKELDKVKDVLNELPKYSQEEFPKDVFVNIDNEPQYFM